MKKAVFILFAILGSAVFAQEPELDYCIQKNNDYIFDYKITKGWFSDKLEYSVKPLDNKPLYFYQRHRFGYPSEITLKLTNEPKTSHAPFNIMGSKHAITRYSKLYNRAYEVYSTEYVFRKEEGTSMHSLSESDFKTVSQLTNTINLTQFLNTMRYRFPKEYSYGKQKINLSINLILDLNTKTCLIYELPEMEHDFGNYYINQIKDWVFKFTEPIWFLAIGDYFNHKVGWNVKPGQ